MNKLLKLLQIFASGTAVQYTGMDANGAYDPTQAGSINVNTGSAVSADAGNLSPEMKTFYDKTLITLAKANLVHAQFGQKRPIPKHGGRTIEFRKFSKLPKALTPITEGVTPAGNKLNVSAVTATVNQYGDYIEQTDLLELTAIDNTIVEATKELAEQAGLTLDSVVRDQLLIGTNVYYVPKRSGSTETPVASRSAIDATALLTPKDVARVATILKNQNAPKINGYYVAIIHPSVVHDLMFSSGEAWKSVMQYAQPENMLKGEVGQLYGVRFVESTEAKVWHNAGSSGASVYATLFLGADAYGVTDIEGGGLEHIVKQRGYGNDPLNQRSSVGWKATETAKILANEYLVRVESGCSFQASASN